MIGLFQQWQEIRKIRRDRIVQARTNQGPKGALHDPIEDDPNYRDLLQLAQKDIDAQLSGIERGMGFCHREWQVKRHILMTKYGVIWFSPADLNPEYRFD